MKVRVVCVWSSKVRHIEECRKTGLRNEGRVLGCGQAVVEWIGRYAEQFPDLDEAP